MEKVSGGVPGPVTPARVSGLRRVRGDPLPRRNAVRAHLEHIRRVAFDLGCAGVDNDRRIWLTLHGDGSTTIVLRGRFDDSMTARTVGGATVPLTASARAVAVRVQLRDDPTTVIVAPR